MKHFVIVHEGTHKERRDEVVPLQIYNNRTRVKYTTPEGVTRERWFSSSRIQKE